MKSLTRITCLAGVLFVLSAFLSQPAFSQAMTKSQLQTMYMDYMRQQGYQADIDSDGDILFKAEGRSYYIIVNDTDLEYFEILFPGFWAIESDDEWVKAAAACSYVSRSIKVAKVFLTSNNDTSIIVDVLLINPKDFSTVFPRMMNIINTARTRFVDEMRK
jgi:hypothetical protein